MILLVMISLLAVLSLPDTDQTSQFRENREEMVRSQLASRGIKDDKLLDAFRKVPRHSFVPEEYLRFAYADQPLPIGYGQTISQPYVVAFMTEILELRPGDKVLEIGTGSGYQAAILLEMEAEVYTIEIVKPLCLRAESILKQLGYKQFHIKAGDGYQGWSEYAPFKAVLVTCSPTEIPPPLVSQLAEGGRMIIPVGKDGFVQHLVLLEKEKGKIREKKVMPVRFVPMVNEKDKQY